MDFVLNVSGSKPGLSFWVDALSSKRSNKINLESRNRANLDQILVPVSVLMDSGLVLSCAIFHGKTLLMALSVGQGCAAIQLCVMDNAPGWNSLAQR